MKTILAFENLQIVLRGDKINVEQRCQNCGGHGMDSVDELEIIPCPECKGSGVKMLHVEDLNYNLEAGCQWVNKR